MSTAADKARRRAAARRQRILAQGAERLDVVNGLAPSVGVVEDDDATADREDVASGSPSSSSGGAAIAREGRETPQAEANEGEAAAAKPATSAGARRMAAMRKRRYKSKQSKQGTEKGDGDDADVANKDGGDAAAVDAGETEEKSADVAEEGEVADEEDATKETEGGGATSPAPAGKGSDDDGEDTPVQQPAETPTEEKKDEEGVVVGGGGGEEEPKRYMGVARMRRKILKEQKAQRLRDIENASDVIGGGGKSSNVDLERELAAEIATMNATASMVRRGQGLVGGGDDGATDLSELAMKNIGGRRRKKWLAALLPPARLVPRLVTLLTLLAAGWDLGCQPHRRGGRHGSVNGVGVHHAGGGNGKAASATASRQQRDLNSLSVVTSSLVHLIHHVEHPLTKPWEYGAGGRAAYIVGMAPSSPPTALPTSFDGTAGVECSSDAGGGGGECSAVDPKDARGGDSSGGNKGRGSDGSKSGKGRKDKRKKRGQQQHPQLLMEDEFDTYRAARPRGVVSDDEFDDATVPPVGGGGDAASNNNIDPLFRVDLDALLIDAKLPYPVDVAARLAIGLHRAWVRCLWTAPTSLLKSAARSPLALLRGWTANPPWILAVALFVRFLGMVLVGGGGTGGKSPGTASKGVGESGKDDDGGGGRGGKKKDILEQVIDTAKNYATSSFPRTTLVLGTLMKVMKVDMYVFLFGMLLGLVTPSIRELSGSTYGIDLSQGEL